MQLQESFIRPLYDRLPFLSISLRSGSSASDAGGAGWDRRVVSEFEMSELGGFSNVIIKQQATSLPCAHPLLVLER